MKRVDQLIDGGKAVFFSDISQMGVTCGCRGAGMTEDRLNMAKA